METDGGGVWKSHAVDGQWQIQRGGGGCPGVWTPLEPEYEYKLVYDVSYVRYTFLRSALREVAKYLILITYSLVSTIY